MNKAEAYIEANSFEDELEGWEVVSTHIAKKAIAIARQEEREAIVEKLLQIKESSNAHLFRASIQAVIEEIA